MQRLRLVLVPTVLLLCSCAPGPSAPPTPQATAPPPRATVIDLTAEFAASESAAIRSRFLDLADLGRLDVGCQVEVLTTTDRAARVRLVSCPSDSTTDNERRAPIGTLGWVVKTALDPQP
ncbi:MAG TPA: hypothetical protein VKV73_18325 [Chloroflexota bacterium]|nr:hypothetical protein [Chloroflexota bacterium]